MSALPTTFTDVGPHAPPIYCGMTGETPDAAAIAARLASVAELDPNARAVLMSEVDALFAAHRDPVYGLCLQFVGNPERAVELAQDTLLTAYLKLPTYQPEHRFSSWLYGIARFKCMNALRKHGELLTDDGVMSTEDPASSVLVGLRRQEREELLQAAAQAVLDPTEQEAVYLRYTEQLPIDRITELIDTDLASGARGVLQRCKRKLEREIRRRLAEMGHGSSFVRGTR